MKIWHGTLRRSWGSCLPIRMNFWQIHVNRLALMNLIMTYCRLHSDLKTHGSSSICLEVKEKADPLLWSVSTAEAHCSADTSFWRSLNCICRLPSLASYSFLLPFCTYPGGKMTRSYRIGSRGGFPREIVNTRRHWKKCISRVPKL